MKKIFCILTAAAICLSVLSGSAFAEGLAPEIIPSEIIPMAALSGPAGESSTWTFDETSGTLTISGTGNSNNYYGNGYLEIDEIQDKIKSVVVESGITSVTMNYDLQNLESVTFMPGSLTSISGFRNCPLLTSVTIPEGVTSMSEAFSGCENLQSISLPSTLTEIWNAFLNDPSLTALSIAPGGKYYVNGGSICARYVNDNYLLDIDDYAFNELVVCPNPGTTYTVPDGVNTIGRAAFQSADVETVIIPSSVTSIVYNAFSFSKVKNVVFSEGLVAIGSSAFNSCANLQSADLPSTVTRIDDYAFQGAGIVKADLSKTHVTKLSRSVFEQCSALKEVNLPETLETMDFTVFNFCTALETIIIPASVKEINNNTFVASENQQILFKGNAPSYPDFVKDDAIAPGFDVTDVLYYVPGTSGWVDSKYYNAKYGTWRGCELLPWDGVNIPEYVPDTSVRTFGWAGNKAEWDFDRETGTLTISGTGEIYKSDYYNFLMIDESLLPLIKKAVVEPGITSIGSNAFENCVNLTEVSLPEGLKNLYYGIFKNCSTLETVVIPEGVEVIEGAFSECTGLKRIHLPSTVKRISNPFYGCKALETITVDPANKNVFAIDNVLYYKYTDYQNIENLVLIFYPYTKTDETYTIPIDITEVGDSAFADHQNIKYINFPDTLVSIEDYAFDLSSIKKVVLPEGFKYFGECCFMDCKELEEINFPSTVTTMSSWASFAGCLSLKKIDLSKTGIVSLGSSSGYGLFSGCISATEVILPPNLDAIIDNCFNSVLPDGEITFPKTVTYIRGGAFNNSPNQKLYFLGDAPGISDYSYNENGYFFDPTDVIYYIPGTSGWTDSKYYDAEAGTWAGSKLVAWDGPAYTSGDVNGSGDVTLDDAILTLKVAMNVDIGADAFIEAAADVNPDGRTTLEDAIEILKLAMHVS